MRRCLESGLKQSLVAAISLHRVFALEPSEGIEMTKKPSYEELEQRLRELEDKVSEGRLDEELKESRELFEKTR